MSAIVEELMRRPDLPSVMNELEEAIADEARRRAEYVEWLDEHKRAEFIQGEVVHHSPERWGHGLIEDNLKDRLKAFVKQRNLGAVAGKKLVRFPRNDYIPDLNYWPKAVSDTFTADTTIFPIPAITIEILSESSRNRDRGIKFDTYAAGGVREYWIVDPDDRLIEQYEIDKLVGRYRLWRASRADDVVTSQVLDGLAFPANEAFAEAAG